MRSQSNLAIDDQRFAIDIDCRWSVNPEIALRIVNLTSPCYQANSAFRRNTRGFMYEVGDCQPGVFGTNVGLNASVTLLFSRL